MQAPKAADLRKHPRVQEALEAAWIDSLPVDAARRHDEKGWVYFEIATGVVIVQRSPSGEQALFDLSDPPNIPGSLLVATFHIHPNPSNEGWYSGPSEEDIRSAWLLGVPCLIRADDGIHITGPESPRIISSKYLVTNDLRHSSLMIHACSPFTRRKSA